jgi:hypothetical protein
MDGHTESAPLKLTINSTHRGFLSRYLVCLFWIGVFLLTALLLAQHARITYEALGVEGWEQFAALPHTLKKHAWFLYPFPLLYGVINALSALAAFFAARILYTLLYSARWSCTFFASDGEWRSVEQVCYRSPFGWNRRHARFDCIFDVTTQQSRLGLDRLFDTGTLIVCFATAVGNGAVEHGVLLRAVHHPHVHTMRLVTQGFSFDGSPPAPRSHEHALAADA